MLSDPEKRKKYDQYGENWKNAGQFENARQQQHRGGRPRQEFSIEFGDGDFSDFFESLFGGGGGSRRNSQVKFRVRIIMQNCTFRLEKPIKRISIPLSVNDKNVRITVPAGIADGQVIRLKGHGGPGVNGGPNGDLHITLSLHDAQFKRLGEPHSLLVELDLYTAVLGGELCWIRWKGKIKLKIKPETQKWNEGQDKRKGVSRI